MDYFREGPQTDFTWVKSLNCELECSCDIQGVSQYASRREQNRTEGGIRLLEAVLRHIQSKTSCCHKYSLLTCSAIPTISVKIYKHF